MHRLVSRLRNRQHPVLTRDGVTKVDIVLHKLLLQSLGVHLRGLVSVFTQESGFRLRSVLALLAEVNRVSRLTYDLVLLNLPEVPLVLPNRIVGLALRRHWCSCVTILQGEVILLHAVALLSVLAC